MGNLRITGLATGLDVDSLVKQLMRVENMKLDKVKQERQVVEWKQELYREIIGELNTFKSTYFDVLKPDKYMLSERNYSNFDVETSGNAGFRATAYAGAVPGDYKVTVKQLAEKARIEGTSPVNIEQAVNDFAFPAHIEEGVNDEITIDLEGKKFSITLKEGYYYMPDLVSNINEKLSQAGGSGKVKAVLSENGQYIRFMAAKEIDDSNKTLNVNIDGTDYTITLDKGTFSLEQIAAQINSKLSAVGINDKIKAEMAEGGNAVNFTDLTEGSSSMTVNCLPIDANSFYDVNMEVTNSNATSNNELKYDRKIYEGVNDTLTIKINGKEYNLDLGETAGGYGKPGEDGASSDEDIRTNLLYKLHNAIEGNSELDGKLDVRLSMDGSRIQFVSRTNETVTVSGNALKTLGFSGSFEINQSVDQKMSILLGGLNFDGLDASSGVVDFVINNGTEDIRFRYDFTKASDDTTQEPAITGAKNMTIKDIMDDIYSKANIKLSYSQLTRKFTIESSATGSAQKVSIRLQSDGDVNTDRFLDSLFGDRDFSGEGVKGQGKDAVVIITNPGDSSGDAVEVHKSTNNFTIDGINYTLNKADPDAETTMTLTSSSQKTFDKIVEFIGKYNEIIDKINSKINEKKQYDYLPLTDEQKKEMSEDEIKRWEEKAKEGLLSRDSTLENMLTSMRRAFFDMVKPNYDDSGSIGISLKDIGLSTSSDYSQRGKIIIDESKLKEAIENKGDKVAELFTKRSSSVPSYDPDLSSSERSQRYAEQGIFQRISDIFQDYMRTTRNDKGQKGILLEKAGIKGDYSEFNNILTEELKRKDKAINELLVKLAQKEEKYYLQFSKLEQAMQKMNAQANWLYQQFNMGGY